MESNGIGCLVAETTGLNGVLKQILLTLSSPTQHSVVNQCLDEEVHDLNWFDQNVFRQKYFYRTRY